LLKSELDDWSWAQQVAKGREGAEWTGIRKRLGLEPVLSV
jgi:predicted RNA-binding protein with PUA-like domain